MSMNKVLALAIVHVVNVFCFDRRLIDEENNQTRYECTIKVFPQIDSLTLRSRIVEVAPSLSRLLPGVVIENEYRVSCKFASDVHLTFIT